MEILTPAHPRDFSFSSYAYDGESSSSLSSAPDYETDSSPQSPTRQNETRQRKRFQSRRRNNLNIILNHMKRLHMTPGTFLKLFFQYKRGLNSDQYLTPQLRQRHLYTPLKELISENPDLIIDILRPEFDALIQNMEQFQRFDPTADPETMNFENLHTDIAKHAPLWDKIIRNLMTSRFTDVSNTAHSARLTKRLFMITSIISNTRAKKQSNYFQKSVGIYLHGLGIKRRSLGLLAGLGICNSPSAIIQGNKDIAAIEEKRIADLKDEHKWVFAYDNINFLNTKRDETISNQSKFQSLTTSVMVECPTIPNGGLKQTMHHPEKKLDYNKLMRMPGIGLSSESAAFLKYRREAIIFHISQAIENVHSDAVKAIFQKSKEEEEPPQFPEINRLGPVKKDAEGDKKMNDNQHPKDSFKTDFRQLPAIAEDEGTIEGNYRIHDAIFRKYLKLSAPADETDTTKDDFKERLFLVHGDQLTVQRIRSVQRERRRYTTLPYDTRRFMLAVPGLFHVQMKLLQGLKETHSKDAAQGKNQNNTIEQDMRHLLRKRLNGNTSKYHLLEPTVELGFNARVLSLFWAALNRRGLFAQLSSKEMEQVGKMSEIIKKLKPADYYALIGEVHDTAFKYNHWNEKEEDDVEFRTSCRYLQEVELFLTLRLAIKYGDVGWLRLLVCPLIIAFIGMGLPNYSQEMLYYQWLLTDVNDEALQRSILASGLVNWIGERNSWKPIDLSLEHLNAACAIDRKNRSNSTRTAWTTFYQICVMGRYQRGLRLGLEEPFGIKIFGNHTRSRRTTEIFGFARKLFVENRCQPRPKLLRGTETLHFDSSNIRKLGLEGIKAKVKKFNDTIPHRKFIPKPARYTKLANQEAQSSQDNNVQSEQDEIREVQEDMGPGEEYNDADAQALREYAEVNNDCYDDAPPGSYPLESDDEDLNDEDDID